MTPSTSDARSRRRSAEPFLWLLFSAGGMVTALVAPVLLLLFGLAFPLGWLDAPDHGHLLAMVRNPITKLVVLVLVVLPCSMRRTGSGSCSTMGCNWAGSTE